MPLLLFLNQKEENDMTNSELVTIWRQTAEEADRLKYEKDMIDYKFIRSLEDEKTLRPSEDVLEIYNTAKEISRNLEEAVKQLRMIHHQCACQLS